MRAYALLAVSALLLTAGCAKKDDNAEMTAPPMDSAPTSPAPAEPSTAPMPSDTPPADTTTPPTDSTQPSDPGTTPPPPAQ